MSLVPVMRLTITILCGTRAGQRFVVAGGDVLRVGRTAKADVVIADDPTMSAVHYELECTEEGGIIRDLQSRNGLFINGEPVADAVLADGDQIRAGRTFFAVSVHDALKPSSAEDSDDETRACGPLDATRMTAPMRPIPTEPIALPPAGAAPVPDGAAPASPDGEAG
ncbi:MAG: FHA domain-containing protein [Pirellulales bacterium]